MLFPLFMAWTAADVGMGLADTCAGLRVWPHSVHSKWH